MARQRDGWARQSFPRRWAIHKWCLQNFGIVRPLLLSTFDCISADVQYSLDTPLSGDIIYEWNPAADQHRKPANFSLSLQLSSEPRSGQLALFCLFLTIMLIRQDNKMFTTLTSSHGISRIPGRRCRRGRSGVQFNRQLGWRVGFREGFRDKFILGNNIFRLVWKL